MPKYAQYVTKSAALSSEFGLQYATRLFGEEAIASLPVLKAGPNKGKVKGFVRWMKSTVPGYSPYIGSGVKEGVVVRAWIGEFESTPEGQAMTGQWMGRSQSLCGSRSVLGPEAREQNAREMAARQAAWEEEKAEIMAEMAARKAKGEL
jgi:hypothetical protein